MNDFDDEATMEEEEANTDQDNEEDELAALEQEQDMPIEELLKMYGQAIVPADQDTEEPVTEGETEDKPEAEIKPPVQTEAAASTSSVATTEERDDITTNEANTADLDHEEEDNDNEVPGAKRRGSASPPPPVPKKSKSELARFYEAAVEGRALRSQGSGQVEEGPEEEYEEEIEESDLENRDYSWKKTIMIGPSYQAFVPSDLDAYGDTLPYENEDKQLWNPGQLASKDVEEYLSKSQEAIQVGVSSLPLGAHVRDDEQALHLLLQCGYNCDEALRRRRMNAVPTAETMTLWSEEECRSFELGLRLYGKDFHMIQSQKVKTRSVGELVQFYYLWKKTERHDVFANNTRLEKKKYTLHPGTTDYMDRFIDEQDSSRDRSSSPNFYSLMFGSEAGGRKGLSLYPGASSKSSFHLSDSNGGVENPGPLQPTSATAPSIQSSQQSPTNGGGRFSIQEDNRENPSEPPTSANQ